MATAVAVPIRSAVTATSSTTTATSRAVRVRGRRAVESGHDAGFRTYPAPRIVWIIGSRPASTFLRR